MRSKKPLEFAPVSWSGRSHTLPGVALGSESASLPSRFWNWNSMSTFDHFPKELQLISIHLRSSLEDAQQTLQAIHCLLLVVWHHHFFRTEGQRHFPVIRFILVDRFLHNLDELAILSQHANFIVFWGNLVNVVLLKMFFDFFFNFIIIWTGFEVSGRFQGWCLFLLHVVVSQFHCLA